MCLKKFRFPKTNRKYINNALKIPVLRNTLKIASFLVLINFSIRMDCGDIDWQIQQNKLTERGKYILKNSLWTDCKFIVGDEQNKKEFKAHQLFLAMSSSVFEKMFKSGYLEHDHDIHIVDIQPEAFGAMLDYVYTDELEIQSFDQACELCYVANKYMIHNLLRRCTAYVLKDINISNACRGYEFAKLFDQKELMDKCKEVIIKQAYMVIAQTSFVEIQMSTLQMILDEKRLNVREIDLFGAVEKWIAAEFARRGIAGENHTLEQEEVYNQVVPRVCFLNMNAKSFADGPALSSLLKPDQSFAILMNLTTSNCSCPFPSGFSTKLREQPKNCCQNKNSLYLNWPLTNNRKDIVYANTESSVSFSCDKDIKLIGVMMTSKEYQPCYLENRVYQENIDIYLHDWTNNAKHVASYDANIGFGQIISIFFSKPIKIYQGRAYNVGVTIKKSGGVYIGGIINSTEIIAKSYKFKIVENPLPLYMRGIIFSE